jgi:hypothetical protein
VPRQLQFCNNDISKGVQYITLTSQCSVFLEGSVTIIADNNDFRVVLPASKSFFLQPPTDGALIAIEYTGECPATSRGRASIELEGTGVALTLLNPPQ